ncbi:MAG: GC-type dockerin domain-anchored protein [Phycisphaerales bacterium]
MNRYSVTPIHGREHREYDAHGNLVGTLAFCPADLDGNGVLNLDDIILFADAFVAREPSADIDGNGSYNLDDIILFADAFNAGCPEAENRFVYDYQNRLVRFDDVATDISGEYAYDALGRRITRVVAVDGAVTESLKYVYDGWQVIADLSSDGTQAVSYVHGAAIDELIRFSTESGDFYVHQDDLGNVVAISDASGEAAEWYHYSDFGAFTVMDRAGATLDASALGLTRFAGGRRFDPESGLYHHRTRYLEPEAGRFITPDSAGAWHDSLSLGNAYTAFGGSPWVYGDPTGMDSKTPASGAHSSNPCEGIPQEIKDSQQGVLQGHGVISCLANPFECIASIFSGGKLDPYKVSGLDTAHQRVPVILEEVGKVIAGCDKKDDVIPRSGP